MNVLESIKYILPELILLGFSLLVLIWGGFVKKTNLSGIFSLAAIMLAAVYLPQSYKAPSPLFFNLLINDPFSEFFKEIFFIIAGIVILISMGYKAFDDGDSGEYYFFLLVLIVGMMLAVSSNNLLMIYIAFEMISLTSYILVGFLKRDVLSSEGALKYFLFGTLATGIMLYGISFIYGLFGTTDMTVILAALGRPNINSFAVLISLIIIFSGIAFKCALVPFHMWVPDAYQGAPTPIAAFISVGPKAAGFAVLIRVFLINFFPLFHGLAGLVTAISILTMGVGNVIALSQTNIKRMLGYSSIAQAGYILIGFVVGTSLGMKATLFYLLAYTIMNLGAFGCIVLISNSLKSDSIEDYAGLYKRDPVAAFMLTIFLLSLAGIPPLAGFLGKFFVFAAAIESKFVLLAIAGIINSIIALYYYVRVIKYMYLEEPSAEGVYATSIPLEVALIIALIGILIIGVWPSSFLNWITASLL